MLVSLIVAMDRGGLIGGESGLPWRLPADLKRFRKLTLGKPVLMGRKTFAQIGRPLPGRVNIILTHDLSFAAPGCRVAHSFPESLAIAGRQLAETGLDEVMVIGGAQVYREALSACGRLYLTVVDGSFEGHTRFPVEQMDRLAWPPAHAEECPPDEHNPHRHWFFILERAAEDGGQGDVSGGRISNPSRPPGRIGNPSYTVPTEHAEGWPLARVLASVPESGVA